MSKEAAQTLHEVSKAHRRIVHNDKYIEYGRGFEKLDNGRVQ
jgi:hypothetical protein